MAGCRKQQQALTAPFIMFLMCYLIVNTTASNTLSQGFATSSNFREIDNRFITETNSTQAQLATVFHGDTRGYGCLFDLFAIEDITVVALDVHVALSTPDIPIQVYTKPGNYQGYELENTAWTKIVDTTVSGRGPTQPTPISPDKFLKSITIKSGSTQAFYITLVESKDMRYSEALGYKAGQSFTQNTHLKILVGAGAGGEPFSGSGGIFEPRGWNGVIRYTIAPKAVLSETASSANSAQSKPVDLSKFPTGNKLETTFEAGNGSYGATFDIVAIKDLVIPGLEFHSDLEVETEVEVWSKFGSFLGFENDSSAWTRIAKEHVMCRGLSKGTLISSSFVPQLIKAGDTRSFYVVSPMDSLKYTNDVWSTLRSIYSANDDIQFLVGSGIGSYPAFGNVIFENRVFNGVVHYLTEAGTKFPTFSITSPPTPIPVTTGLVPTFLEVSGSPSRTTFTPSISPTTKKMLSEPRNQQTSSGFSVLIFLFIGAAVAFLIVCVPMAVRKFRKREEFIEAYQQNPTNSTIPSRQYTQHSSNRHYVYNTPEQM